MADFSSHSIDEAARLVRLVAEPRRVDDSVKAAIRRAAHRLGWGFSRTRNIWYRADGIRISAAEMDALRARAGDKGEEADVHAELDRLRQRLDRLEAYLRS